MKPASFEYFAPTSLDEAIALLSQHGEDAKVLAGGQSLVPLMNMRLARPGVIVDLNRVSGLDYVREHDGGLAFGAITRQRVAERSDLVRARNPLLAEAIPFIGHTAIRNRGTVGGSIAHADPASELPAVAAALDAEMVIRGREGERVATPDEFFLGYLTTAIEPTEILTEVRFPAWPAGAGWCFLELSRRHGDFAIVGVGVMVAVGSNGSVERAAIAYTGVGGTPVRARDAEAQLVGQALSDEAIEGAAVTAAAATDPSADVHASAEYRKEIARVLAGRALRKARERAGKQA